jgi:hypothetical protein
MYGSAAVVVRSSELKGRGQITCLVEILNMNKSARVSALLMALVMAMPAVALEPVAATGADQTQSKPLVRGRDLMTPAERAEHRHAMRNAKSTAERRELRLQMHKKMQQRAKEQGATLPDAPASGSGMGSGRMGKGSPPP